jgi:hypothetical protein
MMKMRSSSAQGWAGWALLPVALIVGGCAAEPNDQDGNAAQAEPETDTVDSVAAHQEALQSQSTTVFGVSGSHTLVVGNNATTAQALSTAAVRITGHDARTPYASCGVTFVSPHLAVTAAHCVDNFSFMFVEEFDTRNLSMLKVVGPQSKITGTYPNWTPGPRLTAADGYTSNFLTNCSVARRCKFAPFNCPIAENPDIALIRCNDRTRKTFATTTASDADGTRIETWWFHEIYDLPVNDDGTERWTHYGLAPPKEVQPDGTRITLGDQNFHYNYFHQLFPLNTIGRNVADLSSGFPTVMTIPAQIRRHDTANKVSWGDLQVCHGTSGSGVFRAGTNVLLGPLIFGEGARLCQPSTQANATGNSAHTSASFTNSFVVNSPEIAADRAGR